MTFLKNFLLITGLFFFLSTNAQPREVLVFHKTEGFKHNSISAGYQTITDLGLANGFKVTETEDSKIFEGTDLARYDLVIFLNTTGDILNDIQQKNFEQYIEAGGSFFGIHSAADTEYEWEWYGRLVGAYFTDHPEIQEANIMVVEPNHPTVAHLPRTWTRTDEWYNYKIIQEDIKVLLMLDESSYKGGNMGKSHPIAWYQNLNGGGKAIYTGGGHSIETYTEPLFTEHLLQCILFAIGDE